MKRRNQKLILCMICKKCFDLTSDAKKLGLRERHKQVQIAKEKKLDNPFLDISHEDYFESGI